jgi:hypothetical protein
MMTSETAAFEPPPPPPPIAPIAPASPGWAGTDLAIGTSLVVLLVALFLPWFSSTIRLAGGAARSLGSGDGPRAHGYLWAVFALAIVALIVLVARDAIGRAPGNLPSAEQMLIGATGLALMLTILGVAISPSPDFSIVSPAGSIPQVLPSLSVSIGWSYGGFVAVLAAAVAFIASFGNAGPVHVSGLATRQLWKRTRRVS